MDQKKMFAEERQKKIYETLKKQKRATLVELCGMFGVSAATMRNDLETLQSSGLIKRTHGGAIIQSKTSFETVRSERVENKAAKIAIARAAAEHVEDGDTIAIDQGTTCYEMVQFLRDKRKLIVVVNDFEIALALEKTTDAMVIMLGGIVRKNYSSVYGSMTEECIRNLCVDKLFLGTNAVSVDHGLTTPHSETADVKRALVSAANEIFALADSTKIGRVSLFRIIASSVECTVITDSGLSEESVRAYDGSGFRFEIV